MASKLPPIYKDHGKTYQADTCLPLVEAVQAGQVRLEAFVHGSYPGRPLPDMVLPGLCTVGYWDAVGEQQWGLDFHRNEGIELTFLETGNLPFTVEDQHYLLQPNDLTITRPWQPHRVGQPYIGSSRLHWVILDLGVRRPNQDWKWPAWVVLAPEDLNELTTHLRHNERPVWQGTPEIRRCFGRIGKAVEVAGDTADISRITVYLNEILVLVLELVRQCPTKLNPSLTSTARTVELFLADMKKNLQHEWTLKLMADSCGLGTTYFVHHCRRLTNMAPMHYLNYCRVQEAARMLEDQPGMSVTDIAYACGFSSSQYFSTVFHRFHGCTPRDYRQRG